MSASRSRTPRAATAALAAGAALLLAAPAAQAQTVREEAMIRARTMAFHPWRCTQANFEGGKTCYSQYQSAFQMLGVGDYLGLAYGWGNFKSVYEFDQDILNGLGAGQPPTSATGVGFECTTGVDCSSFVCQAWDVAYAAATSAIVPEWAETLSSVEALLPADALNQAGYHIRLFSHRSTTGEPVIYESWPAFYTVTTEQQSWSTQNGYTPIRRTGVQGNDDTDPEGTPTKPIVGPSFPGDLYTHAGDTYLSSSDALDGCGIDTARPVEGPEVVYEITITQSGTLRATLSGDVTGSVDNDIHLYTSMNTSDCIARGDVEILEPVDCGTYWVVVDTYGTDETIRPGAYSLQMELQNPTGTCGAAGPAGYDFKGGIGAPCTANSYCDRKVANKCLTASDGSSFCSKQCNSNADCIQVPGANSPRVCCAPVDGIPHCVAGDACIGTGTGGAGTGGSGVGAESGTYTFGAPRDDRENGADITRCATVASTPGRGAGGSAWWALLTAAAPAAAGARRRQRRRS